MYAIQMGLLHTLECAADALWTPAVVSEDTDGTAYIPLEGRSWANRQQRAFNDLAQRLAHSSRSDDSQRFKLQLTPLYDIELVRIVARYQHHMEPYGGPSWVIRARIPPPRQSMAEILARDGVDWAVDSLDYIHAMPSCTACTDRHERLSVWTTVARCVSREDVRVFDRSIEVSLRVVGVNSRCLLCRSVLREDGKLMTGGTVLCGRWQCRGLVLAFIDSAVVVWALRAVGLCDDIVRVVGGHLVDRLPPH